MNIANYVLYHARITPEKPAIVYTGGVATYAMVAAAVHAAAAQIQRAGLGPGTLAAIDVRDPFRHMVLILALERCGITSVSVQTTYGLAASGLRPAAVILDRFGGPVAGARTLAVDEDWFDLDLAGPGPGHECRSMAPGQYTRIVLSSGTTGVPKAIGLTPEVMGRRLLDGLFWGGAGERTLTIVGVSTTGSFHLLYALASGGVACFAPNPEEILHLVRLFGITQMTVMVGQLRELVNHQSRHFGACPTLRRVTVGGGRPSPALVTEARASLCSELLLAYGTTETGVVVYGQAGAAAAVEGAVGHVAPWGRVEAVDETGQVLPAGRHGRLRLWSTKTGEYVAGRAGDRAILDRDGWFYPGDIGAVHGDGLVAVFGKDGELINRGGVVVAPQFVEDVLRGYDGIRDAGVVGVQDDPGPVEIWAGVVAGDAFDEWAVHDFCARRLGDMAPDVVVLVDAIPRTDTGKVIRDRLRDVLRARRAGADDGGPPGSA
ncbi:MAG: acyl--CoA ligase [Hyphomicrobiales bacterium]|nr:acyl--CoA ligase [Hyphomicrobiales bacterium]MCP5374122.1 acyl--CoA ligase [Hyphomicrobiales bacterium]